MTTKYLSMLFALMLLLFITACGSKSGTETVQTESIPASENTSVPETTVPVETEELIPFEETVLVDNEDCTVKITGIDADNIWGYTLNAYVENKTDKELMFTLNNVSVNGFMCDPLWAVTVTPGMKANEEISFLSADFDRNGVETVTEIALTLRVYDSNDWSADDFVNEIFTLYPLGEDAVKPFERISSEDEIVLFDNESCTMIVTGFDPDSTWGYTMNVYLENKTDQNLMFTTQDASVNGFMCDPYWATTVAAGKRSYTGISWMSSDFEDNGIAEVESLTLPIRVYNSDDWTEEDILKETFTVNP